MQDDPKPAQALTPLVRKKNLENELYQAWKDASPEVRPAIQNRLLHALRSHAAKVCWLVLHSHQPDLISEISQDAILELGHFQERSAFSTWFHSRALNRCREEVRKLRIRKEVPLDVSENSSILRSLRGNDASAVETGVIVRELWSRLDDESKELIELKVFDELSDAEVAEQLGKSRSGVQLQWSELRERLRKEYASKIR